jgi:hypothetical protein
MQGMVDALRSAVDTYTVAIFRNRRLTGVFGRGLLASPEVNHMHLAIKRKMVFQRHNGKRPG